MPRRQLLQRERPAELEADVRSVPQLWREVGTRQQHQRAVRLDLFDREEARGCGWAVRDSVADGELLELGDDGLGARTVRREQQTVDPSMRVPAATAPAHLHEPR